jgi:hypothetical protein
MNARPEKRLKMACSVGDDANLEIIQEIITKDPAIINKANSQKNE